MSQLGSSNSRNGGYTASLSYDPNGRLVTSTGTRLLYDGDALVAEYDPSGNLLRRYVHGPGVDEPLVWYEGAGVGSANRRFLHADHEGSIVAVSDSGGNMLRINTFDEYGIPGVANSNLANQRFAYTGQILIPELGLYHYKARAYSPVLGRFMQTDPVGYKDQVNLHEYVGDDPIDRTDPTGLECTLNGKSLTCSIKVVIPAGQKGPTPKQRAFANRVLNNYMRTVARLLNSNRSTTVGATGGRRGTSFNISAKQDGQSLANRKIYVRPGQSGGDALMDTGGHPVWGAFTNVYEGEEGRKDPEMQQDFAHEGIHASMQELLGNQVQQLLGVHPYREQHQQPYNDAAKKLLGDER